MKVYVYHSKFQNKKNMHFIVTISNFYKNDLIIDCS